MSAHTPSTGALPTRALTCFQPWAWLLAKGTKPVENRPPAFSHKNFRGEFWIHAGGYRSEDQWHAARAMCDEILGKDFELPSLDELAFSAIIGRATIVGIVSPRDTPSLLPRGEPVPWHFPNQYGFLLEGAAGLRRPVSCRGYQGFWGVPPAVLLELLSSEVAT